jgi:hypothetical protein
LFKYSIKCLIILTALLSNVKGCFMALWED